MRAFPEIEACRMATVIDVRVATVAAENRIAVVGC